MLSFVALIVLAIQATPIVGQTLIPPRTGGGGDLCQNPEELEAVKNEIRLDILTSINPTSMCGGTPGWTRIFYLDMSNTSQQCPPPLVEYTYDGVRLCGRISPRPIDSCTSTMLPANDNLYTEVCGKIIGYQYGGVQSFGFYAERYRSNTIDQYYVDGITLTHGLVGGREHIWTFASGIAETHIEYACPGCALSGLGVYNANPPPYVGEDYFCESGTDVFRGGIFYNDPLWDGDGCSAGVSCCTLHGPPYFTKQLQASTTDDIEMRLCSRGGRSTDGNTLLRFIELYVK